MVKTYTSEDLGKALTEVGYELKVFKFEPGSLGMKLGCRLENGLAIVKVLENTPDSQGVVLGVPVGSIIMKISGEDVTLMKSLAEINRAIAVEIEGCKLLGKQSLEITMMVPLLSQRTFGLTKVKFIWFPDRRSEPQSFTLNLCHK